MENHFDAQLISNRSDMIGSKGVTSVHCANTKYICCGVALENQFHFLFFISEYGQGEATETDERIFVAINRTKIEHSINT